jgi:hypothetical protein
MHPKPTLASPSIVNSKHQNVHCWYRITALGAKTLLDSNLPAARLPAQKLFPDSRSPGIIHHYPKSISMGFGFIFVGFVF